MFPIIDLNGWDYLDMSFYWDLCVNGIGDYIYDRETSKLAY